MSNKKLRYRVDLSGLHAECTANYVRLLRLFPAWQQQDFLHLNIGDDQDLQISVLEKSRYTSLLQLEESHTVLPLTERRRCTVRVYHDAQMAEVISWNNESRIKARYQYPNKRMLQEDEKWQLNCFLGEWLSYCLQQGRARDIQTLCSGIRF
ncbi:MAG: DUF1249 domain-containing protein [Pseudomonadales bacterium]